MRPTREEIASNLVQVRLNDEIRCIRDAGKWKDCPGGSTMEDLIRDIEAASALMDMAESDDL